MTDNSPKWSLSSFASLADANPRSHEFALEELEALLLKPAAGRHAPKAKVPCWSPTRFAHPEGGRARRCLAHAQDIGCLVLDFDAPGSLAVVDWAFEGYSRLRHTSYSHRAEKPKARMIVPLAKPVPVAAWPAVVDYVLRQGLGSQGLDLAALRDIARLYLRPAFGAEYRTWTGQLLDLSELAAEALQDPQNANSSQKRADTGTIAAAVFSIRKGKSGAARAQTDTDAKWLTHTCPTCRRADSAVQARDSEYWHCHHEATCGASGHESELLGARSWTLDPALVAGLVLPTSGLPSLTLWGGYRSIEAPMTPEGRVDFAATLQMLSALPQRPRCLVLDWGRGQGKTEFAAYIRQLLPLGGHVIGVSPTQSLAGGLARRLQVPDYRRAPSGSITGSVAVCANSLPRVQLERRTGPSGWLISPADLVVLDEAEQILRALSNSTYSDAEARATWNSLLGVLANSQLTLLLDADADVGVQSLLAASSLSPSEVVRLQAPAVQEHSGGWTFLRPTQARAEYLEDVRAGLRGGPPVVVYSQSKEQAETYRQAAWDIIREEIAAPVERAVFRPLTGRSALRQVTPARRPSAERRIRVPRIQLATSDHEIPTVEAMNSADVLIYSPVLQTGVDLQLSRPPARLHAVLADHSTVQDALQGLARVRNGLYVPVIVAGRRQQRPEAWKFDPAEVAAAWTTAASVTARVVGHRQLSRFPDALDRMYAALSANDARNGLGWTYSALAAHVGQDLTPSEDDGPAPKRTRAEREATKAWARRAKQVADARAERVARAAALSELQAERIRRAGARNAEERAQMERHAVEQFYGQADLTTVKADKQGRTRARLRRLALALDEQAARAVDQAEVSRGENRLSHATVRGALDREFLRIFGFEAENEASSLFTTDREPELTWHDGSSLLSWGRRLAQLRRGLRAVAQIPASVTRDPIRYASSLARSLGLKLQSRRVGDSRQYRLDPSALTWALERSAHYREGLQPRQVAAAA